MGDTFVRQQTYHQSNPWNKQTNKQTGSSKYYPSEIISPQFKGVVFSLSQTLTEALAFFIAHSSKLWAFSGENFPNFMFYALKAQSSNSTYIISKLNENCNYVFSSSLAKDICVVEDKLRPTTLP